MQNSHSLNELEQYITDLQEMCSTENDILKKVYGKIPVRTIPNIHRDTAFYYPLLFFYQQKKDPFDYLLNGRFSNKKYKEEDKYVIENLCILYYDRLKNLNFHVKTPNDYGEMCVYIKKMIPEYNLWLNV
jgi:hypothetical protein